MPAPLLVAGIAAGAQLGSSAINAFSQGKMNKKTMRYNTKMYKQQRKDMLADWAMQNEYNSPQAQMARMKAAGLNPHLVYDSGAQMSAAQSVGRPDVQGWNPRAPQVDLGAAATAGIAAYQDTRMKDAQVDNLTAQNNVLQQEQILKAMQVLKTGAEAKHSVFDLEMKERLKEISAEAAAAGLEKLKSETVIMLNKDEREAALNAQSVLKAAEEILNLRVERAHEKLKMLQTQASTEATRAQIAKTQQEIFTLMAQRKGMYQDQTLKAKDLEWRQQGITPGDKFFWRQLAELMNKLKRRF